jgi:hypothetical protein
LAAVAVLAATAVSAVGAISAGNAQKNAAGYNAAVDRNNSIQAQNAADAQAVVQDQNTKAKLGAQKVAYAASGVDPNTGTPLDVMTNTATQGKLDALTLRYGGQVQGLRNQSAATIAEYEGSQAQTAGYLGAAGSLLTGGAKAFGPSTTGGF